jgi:hypothetical protein
MGAQAGMGGQVVGPAPGPLPPLGWCGRSCCACASVRGQRRVHAWRGVQTRADSQSWSWGVLEREPMPCVCVCVALGSGSRRRESEGERETSFRAGEVSGLLRPARRARK